MTDCCTSKEEKRRHRCPVNGRKYPGVASRTLKQHCCSPWRDDYDTDTWYFCADPECPVVYFSVEGRTVTQEGLRTPVGIKQRTGEAPICYCFGISYAQAQADPGLRRFVIEETRKGHCACEVRNPSGRCCLSEFRRVLPTRTGR